MSHTWIRKQAYVNCFLLQFCSALNGLATHWTNISNGIRPTWLSTYAWRSHRKFLVSFFYRFIFKKVHFPSITFSCHESYMSYFVCYSIMSEKQKLRKRKTVFYYKENNFSITEWLPHASNYNIHIYALSNS